MFDSLKHSILGRAEEKKIIEIELINIRDFSKNKYNQVDDTPYGGGAGMVMMPDIVSDAIKYAKDHIEGESKVIYLSPKGKVLDQDKVISLSKDKNLILLCGHYEGIDQRVIDKYVDEEISIGDYVLTGGEIPAMVLVDTVSRYIDGVLSKNSTIDESFSKEQKLLEYPQYTKPFEFEGVKVPEILISGNHQEIDKWREKQALITTYKKRKDLLNEAQIKEAEDLINNQED
jgi:tRNA (guanine37-N1)-methyltransferase